ncbi:HD domain-containing phosphohydrolase [Pelosinus sp. IPA-1]|uniref:HD-GYP domain-containing protein n=1 Tax=Pelosinus sp. IPA-1 TaxID=3029569 RepID=UPI0024361AA2|nr:HD domain-containing phosphohydrolase [Pelosinus sp. IPA-1]GMA99934.1 HDIG domain-containing protein [Pelosinus sp. IPA-1]
MLYNIHPINLFRALSLALELSNGGLSRHHWRTAMISNRIGEAIGMDEWQRQILVYAALLHDLGAAARWEEKARLHQFEVGRDIYEHAEGGYHLLKNSSKLSMLAKPIRHHHDFWDGSSPSGLAGDQIPLISRIINVADRIEILIRDKEYILGQRAGILNAIRNLSGIYFDPDLVKALNDFSKKESFWLELADPNYAQHFFNDINRYGHMRFNIDDILEIAEIFANIIDHTSSFTGAHSRNVAMVSSFLSKVRGYSEEESKAMRIAGLLHDLGKLAVPNEILEKPGQLTSQEFSLIKQHTYYTYRILEQIDGFGTIAEWAAYHHETLDGSGYPFRIKESQLKNGSRIVAVADVFAALTENRPYRPILPPSKVKSIMCSMVDNKKIDGNLVEDLFKHFDCVYDMVQIKI